MPISDELKNEIEVAVDYATPEVDENDKQNLDENEETNNDSQGDPASEEGDRDDSSDGSGDNSNEEGEEVNGDDDDDKDGNKSLVSESAIAEALGSGITVAEAMALGSDEKILKVVGLRHEDRVRELEAEEQAQAEADAVERQKADDDSMFADFPELDPEEHSPEFIKSFELLKDMARKQHEQIRSFEQQREARDQVADAAQVTEVKNWFDGQVSTLGKDFEKALGTGRTDDLAPGSPAALKRDQVAGKMAMLLHGYGQAGLKTPSREEVFGEAARLVLRDEYAAKDETALAVKMAKRSGQEINRAGGKKSKNQVSPQDEVAAELDRKFFGK